MERRAVTAHVRQFLDKATLAGCVLPHVSPAATPSEIEHGAWWVERELKRGNSITARAYVEKLNECLTVPKIDFDNSDDVVEEIRARAWMTQEQREGDR